MGITEPVKEIKDSGIKVAVWKNKSKFDPNIAVYSVSIQKSFKTQEGKWQQTESYMPKDLLILSRLLNKAYDFIKEDSE